MTSSTGTTPATDFIELMNENNRLLFELANEVSELQQLNTVAASRRTVYGIIEPTVHSNNNGSTGPTATTNSSTKGSVSTLTKGDNNQGTVPTTPSKSFTVTAPSSNESPSNVPSQNRSLSNAPLSYDDLMNANTNTLEQYMDKIKEQSLSHTKPPTTTTTAVPTNSSSSSSSMVPSTFSTPQTSRWNTNTDKPIPSLSSTLPPFQDTLSTAPLPSSTPVSTFDTVHARLAAFETEIQSSNKMNHSYLSKAETSKSLLEAYLRNDSTTSYGNSSGNPSSSSASLLTPLSFKQAFQEANSQVRAPPSRPAPKAPMIPSISSSSSSSSSIPAVASLPSTAPSHPPPTETLTVTATLPSSVSVNPPVTNTKEQTVPPSHPDPPPPSSTASSSLPESHRSSMNDSMDGIRTPSLPPSEENKPTENVSSKPILSSVPAPISSTSPAPLAPESFANSTVPVPPPASTSPNPRPRTPVSRIFVTDVDPTDHMISSVRGRSITKFKHPQDSKGKLTTLTDLSTNTLGSSTVSSLPEISIPSHHPATPSSSSSLDLKSPLSVRIAQYRNEPGQFDERMLAAKGRLIAQATLSSSIGIANDDTGSTAPSSRSPSRSPSRSRAPLVVTAPVPNFGHILSGAHRLQHFQYGPSTAELIAMQKAQEAAEAEARQKREAELAVRRQAEAEARAKERANQRQALAALRDTAVKQAQHVHDHGELQHKPSFFSAEGTTDNDAPTEGDTTLKTAAQMFSEKKNKGPFGRLGARALLKAAAHSIMEAQEATSPTAEQVKTRLEDSTDDKMASLVKLAAKKAVAEGNTNLRLGSLTTRTQATHRGQLAREVQQLMTRPNIHQLMLQQQHAKNTPNPYQTKEVTSASAFTDQRANTVTATQDLVSPLANVTSPTANEVVSPILTKDLNEIFSTTTNANGMTSSAAVTSATNNLAPATTTTNNNRDTNIAIPSTPTVVTPIPTPANTETVPTSASAMTGSGTPSTDASPAPKKKGFSGIARSVMGVFGGAKKAKETTTGSPKK